jgi:dTDP-4-amino-4,6-dideoxygalactose transaminase
MTSYNSHPLGKLPEKFQRPELELVKELGISWKDPRDIIDVFEKMLAEYAGSKFAVVTDTCSHAIFLSLKYRNFKGKIEIPRNTYISVPMQIIHSGAVPVFRTEEWEGIYELSPVNIIDGAARFTKNMYFGDDSLHTLSFQIKKRLPIGKGGAILTDSVEAYRWLKLSSYDGRDLKTNYDSDEHIKQLGWHYYMTPEDAARGILLFNQLSDVNDDSMTHKNYPDVSNIISTILAKGNL